LTGDLHYTRIIRAPPGEVFDILTSPGGQAAFYETAEPGWIVRSESDVRIGGSWTIAFGRSPAELYRHDHVFDVIDPPRRLLLQTIETRLDGSTLQYETAFTLEECEEGTRIRMTLRGLPTDELRSEHARGLPNAFDQFEQVVRGGEISKQGRRPG
jgi:uncharacterized protein YndB with AHSA1/START domain